MQQAAHTKERLLRLMGDYVLARGLADASLRPLAKAAGTSDRMLIYHFKSKDRLVAELLQHLAVEFRKVLDEALPERRAPTTGKLMHGVVRVIRQPDNDRYIRIWLEIVVAAKGGSKTHAEIGRGIVDIFMAWIAKRLPASSADQPATLELFFALTNGMYVLDAVGRSDIADAANTIALPR
jgi:AcrR family transcriptional regulator